MFATILTNRAVVAVGGEEARSFLDRLLTNSLAGVSPQRACHAALLTPQGKMVAEAIVSEIAAEEGGGFLLDVARSQVDELVAKLGLYRLRAKVTVAEVGGEAVVVALWGEGAPGTLSHAVADPRLPALGYRAVIDREGAEDALIDAGATLEDERAFHRHRIALGVPEPGLDYVLSETFPHEADMDQLAGIDFRKGCFIGQEVVARMQHRGTARTRVVPVVAADGGFLPEGGLPVLAGEKTVGTMGSAVEGRGLALLRLDRVADALAAGLPLVCGGVHLTPVKPDWATFAFPGEG
ncbi:YgfZ/GcvT domain-containing protein [Blastochloris sulfoviridis]|uniref:Folate-binding protein YgfZ n=1 Tax=Blastochloris sulfoviridis TaxID=50712 RepID=A0A5M6HWS4_9HYPH|nr:folate-binding protein YgfZ [Blastochloris sulfoviridis]KAA5600364.1 folate-binding protein YgfZ [Blastochloris sulfoviridis]